MVMNPGDPNAPCMAYLPTSGGSIYSRLVVIL